MTNNDINILIKGLLDAEGSIKDINATIHKLSNNKNLRKLKLKTEIDHSLVSDYTKQIEKLQQQVNRIIKNDKGITLIDGSQKKEAEKLHQEVDEIVNSYKKINNVKDVKVFKDINDQTKQVEGFIIQVNKANDVVEKFKYNLVTQQTGDNQFATAYVMDDIVKQIDNSDKLIRQQQKTLVGTYNELKKEQLEAVDIARVLSREYGNLEVVEKSLDQVTGKYAVTLRMTAKENLVLKGSIDQTAGAVYKQSEVIKEAQRNQLGIMEQFKIAAARVPVWLGATTIYFQSFAFMRQLITDISDIDSAMIELSKVVDSTDSELKSFMYTAPEVGKKLGVLTKDVINTTAEIAKLGYSLKDAGELSELSLLGKVVGDLDNVDDSVSYLTSTLKGFKMETGEASQVVDYFNNVANTSSVNYENLGEGMKRASAALSEANNSLSQSTGLLVAGFDVTRDAEKTATALRTTALRIRGVGEEGEDLSELVPTLEKKFARFGLTLKQDENTFKSTYDIFKDLSEIWNSISDMERASILEDIAGKRNANVIAAVIGNFSQAQTVMEKYNTSAGSAWEEHTAYVEGVEYAYNNLLNTMTQLNQKLLDSQTIVDTLNMASMFIGNVAALGKFNIAILAGVAALGLYTVSTRKAILASQQFTTTVDVGGIKGFASGIKTATLSLLGIGSAAKGATFSMVALNTAMTGILLGLPLLAQGIGYLIRKRKESLDQNIESIKSLGDETKAIDEMILQVESLQAIEDKNAEQKEQLIELEKRLATALPQSTTAYDEQNNALATNLDLVRQLNDEKKEEMLREATSIVAMLEPDIEKKKQDLEEYKQQALEIFEAITKKRNGELVLDQRGNIVSLEDLGEALDEVNEKISETSKEVNQYESSLKTINLLQRDMIDSQKKYLSELVKNNGAMDENQWVGYIAGLKSVGFTQDMVNGVTDEYNKILKDTSNSINSVSQANQTQLLTNQQLQESIKGASDSLSLLNSAQQEMQDEGELSSETILQMVEKYADFIDIVGDGESAILDFIKTKRVESVEFINEEKKKTNGLIEQAKKRLEVADKEYKAYDEYLKLYRKSIEASIIAKQSAGIIDDVEADKLIYNLDRNLNSKKNNVDYWIAEIEKYENKMQGLTKLEGVLLNPSSSNSKSSTSSNSKEEYLSNLDIRYRKLEETIAQLNSTIDLNDKKLSMAETESDKIAILNEQIDLYQKMQEGLHALNQERRKEREEVAKSLRGLGFNVVIENDQAYIKNLGIIKNLTGDNAKKADELTQKLWDLDGAIDSTGQEWYDYKTSIQSAEKEMYDIKKQIADDTIDIMKAAYEKQRDMELAIYDQKLKKLEETHEAEMEMLDEKLSKYEEIINAKLKEIDLEAEKEDYQKRLTNAQKEAQDIQNKINILTLAANSGDISAKAEIEDLSKQLADKQIEITEMQDEHTRDIRKQNLQDQLDAYRNDVEAKKKAEDDKYNAEKNRLETLKRETEWYYNEIINNETYWTKVREEIIAGHLKNIETALQESLKNLEGYNEDTVKALNLSYQTLLSNIASVKSALNSLGGIDYGSKPMNLENEILYLKNLYSTGTSGQKAWAKQQAQSYGVDISKYHNGGVVGDNGNIPEYINKWFNIKPGEQLTKSLIGELQIPPKNFPNFLANLGNVFSSLSPTTPSGSIYNLNLNIESVTGDKNGGQVVFKEIVDGLKKMGRR